MSLEGLDSLLSKLDKISQAKGLQNGISKATLRVERTAKDLSPVDTGFNKAAINSNVYPTYGEVVAGTEYARDLEYGTYKMAAQPFMFPALELNRKFILEDIREGLLNG